ncbi:MAG: hypothetical protein COC05_05820 [Gammaproteobacteria bacterium]|nr:MAG: hypothetical protein COC05_05820 [Gammaproteobacteria bacterium]
MDILFRSLLIFTAILTSVFFFLPYFDHMWLPYEQVLLLDRSGLGASIPNSNVIYWGTLIVWLLITFGLFFYYSLARVSFVVFYVIGFIATLFHGAIVLAPYESLISSLISLADGAILAIMYLTSIGDKFEINLGGKSIGESI